MISGSASRTALGVARRRAAHQVLDDPVVFRDPLAGKVIGGDGAGASRDAKMLRAFVAARSRYAEDQLAASFHRGTEQYVVLGAGLDTFAYRNPHAPPLKVFEVDHPDTQAWKKERLRAARMAIPKSLTFVPVNFEIQDLARELSRAPGFETNRPAFFSMLGVTPYLTKSAFRKTLRMIASMPSGSGVAFDYAVAPAALDLWDRVRLKMLAARVRMAGEAFRLFLEPHELEGTLRELGFTDIQDLGRDEINALYFQNRRDGLQVGGAIGRLLSASVPRAV